MRKISRRQFFRLNPLELFELTRKEEPKALIRPPGAIDEDHFGSVCHRCGECSKACPYEAIYGLGPSSGSLEGTPVMEPEVHPCRLCADLPCIKACPSGALVTPVEKVPAMASVKFLPEKCLNTEGILCDACEGSCPPQISALKMKGPFSKRVPEIDLQRCVGCGLCAYYCEEQGNALKIEAIRPI